jgi:hypothetical protein
MLSVTDGSFSLERVESIPNNCQNVQTLKVILKLAVVFVADVNPSHKAEQLV